MSVDATRRAAAARLLPLLDLTSLEDADTADTIARLCGRAVTPFGTVAAVCIHPRFVAQARAAAAPHGIRVATVVNFPDGGPDADAAADATRRAVADWAAEIDLVLPYRAFLAGDTATAMAVLRAVRAACPGRLLKVILETGQFPDAATIRRAADLAVTEGADFLKTSTGKTQPAATPEATRVLLEVAAAHGGRIGVKPAGGLRDTATAARHLAIADELLGPGWASPATFRIGASSLLDALSADLGASRDAPPAPTAY